MHKRRKRLTGAGVLAGCALFLASSSAVLAATTVVHPGDLDGWTTQVSGTGQSVTFESGPATPPLGAGSVELSVGADGDGAAQVRNAAHGGTRVDALTALGYSTYVDQDGSGGQAPYVILHVDYDGDGAADDLLLFEPAYQSATYFPSNPQPALMLDTWQTWDALGGGWWSVFGTAGASPGAGVKSLTDILAVAPDATIVNTGSGLGGVRIVAGFGAGAWDDFVGNADAFVIDTATTASTYDFEVDPPSPTSREECKDGGWQGYGFASQGQCIRFVNTGQDSR